MIRRGESPAGAAFHGGFMNRNIIRSRLFGFVLVIAFVSVSASAEVRLGFKAYGGLNYLGGGDLNRGTEGMTDSLKLLIISGSISVAGEYSPVHWGLDIGGDLILEFAPSFGISLGAGYVESSKSSLFTFSNISPLHTLTMNANADASAVRLSFQVYYVLPTTSGLSVVFHAGPEFYLAQVHSQAILWANNLESIDFDTQADGRGFGFQGGLGLEYDLSPNFGFFIEAVGRYADFAGFEGKTYVAFDGGSSFLSYDGILYYYDNVSSTAGTQMLIRCSPTVPNNPDYRNVREAKVDFSGFSIRLGAVIRLGPRN